MIKSTSKWDEEFFNKFITISHEFYLDHPDYIKETLDNFAFMLKPESPFNLHNKWKAWLVEDENQKVLGRIFASTRTDQFKQKNFMPVGYFEAINLEVAQQLFSKVEEFAKENDYTLLRGPINGNVFNQSRFMTKQTQSLFLSEPLHREEYLDYFKQSGFKVSQRWITSFFDFKGRVLGMLGYIQKYNKKRFRNKEYNIRQINMTDWDEELKLIYELMMDSYSEFDDVELITYKEFKVWTDSLKYIIHPKNCLILEHKGEPLGFLLGLRDQRRQLANLSKNNNIWNKSKFLAHYKLHRGRLLLNYLGKKKNAEGRLKGVSIKLFRKMSKIHKGFLWTPTIFGFISEKSKTLKIISHTYKKSSEYCMYEKEL